ncbi:23S rRNA (pseudouridine(1915)-N(3))-methyltransferase RlmH [Rickettsiales bacterium]|nr:23S rRNA (pseudouridine(1915)-N(3))-methyltransferase RlmH [Rickettsiales bacterium]
MICDSIKFSQIINENLSNKEITFIIGGAFGLDKKILSIADITISLSKLTFPHMLVRLILIEQIYRSFTIINNHPYHKI